MRHDAYPSRIEYSEAGRLAVESLKVCPLCHAVNSAESGECFVCGWHGVFGQDPLQIEDGLAELIDRCPDLGNAVLDESSVSCPRRSARIRAFLRRLLWRTAD